MMPKRPLFYLSLPGIALVLGLIWFRRKKGIHCDTGGKKQLKDHNQEELVAKSSATSDKDAEHPRELKHSQSLPIKCDMNKNEAQSVDTKLGKSAPIDINPSRISPAQLTDQQIDAEILKLKIQDSEFKALKAIEEQDFESISPIDLPDSVDRRRFSFSSAKKTRHDEEPIIIKATMAPKISPKHSFVENKYREDEESNNLNRDSANHSPDELSIDSSMHKLLATTTEIRNPPPVSSPPLSLCSVQSTDSGKGSSSPRSTGSPITIHEFVIQQSLIGQLLGRNGSHAIQIKSKSGATVVIKKHPDTNKFKICALEGTQKEIDAALLLVRQKFPEKRHPKLTLEKVHFAGSQVDSVDPIIDTTMLQLQLIESINNDVIVSAVASGDHIFFQSPLHPSYPSLNILQNCMNNSYSLGKSPMLGELLNDAICVGCVNSSWFRVQIITHCPEDQTCLVKYLDYGGYCNMQMSDLRQIRADFLTVPFQAIECMLSNLRPIGNEWTPEAAEVLFSLTQGCVLTAQITGYTPYGLPEVHLYACLAPNNIVFINKELVARNLATWVEDNELTAY